MMDDSEKKVPTLPLINDDTNPGTPVPPEEVQADQTAEDIIDIEIGSVLSEEDEPAEEAQESAAPPAGNGVKGKPEQKKEQPVPGEGQPAPCEERTVPSEGQPVPCEVQTVPSEEQPVPCEGRTVPSEGQPAPCEVQTVPSEGQPALSVEQEESGPEQTGSGQPVVETIPEKGEPEECEDEPPADHDQKEEPVPQPAKKPEPRKPDLEPIDFSAIDREYVEKAVDPKEYQVYDHQKTQLPGGTELELFAASRIGLGHLQKKTACQDSCLYRVIPQGVILADADGISACSRSDTGSRLACEIAADEVEAAGRQCPEEDAFVRMLCTDKFYSGLREKWIAAVTQHWLENGGDKDKSPLIHYGTTLLIAVITEHWYVTLNLGDGQILLFNELECMKTQLVDKESQAPPSLIYDDYLEDVRRGVWPRQAYKAILLMTDGMNDRLAVLPSYPCHSYAVQALRRFMENGEPRLPFVLTTEIKGDMRTYDVSRQRNASDDFSVVMAVNTDYEKSDTEQIFSAIRGHIPDTADIQLLRRTGKKASYLIRTADGYSIVLAVPESELIRETPEISIDGMEWWEKAGFFEENGLSYTEYHLPESYPALFLEEGTQEFAFKSAKQYHKIQDSFDPVTLDQVRTVDPLIGQHTVRLMLQLRELDTCLGACGLKLNEMAFPWILWVKDDRNTVLIPREVLSAAGDSGPKQPWYPGTDQITPALLGYLSMGDEKMAVFSPGAAKESASCFYYLFGTEGNDPAKNQFFSVIYDEKANRYGLRNISGYEWLVSGNEPEAPEKTIGQRHITVFTEGKKLRVMKDGQALLECVMHTL